MDMFWGFFEGSSEKQNLYIQREEKKETYHKELTHVIVEAEKSRAL